MANINIPFKTDGGRYTDHETRAKDAVTLETLQRIANALEDISAKLDSGGK
jgi:hypothetical protein